MRVDIIDQLISFLTIMKNISLIPVKGLPGVKPGDNLPDLIAAALEKNSLDIEDGDIIVVAQKIVSKAEDRIVNLDDVEPSAFAEKLSLEISKDPRLVEVILSQTKKIIRMDQRVEDKGRLIVETIGGVICANAGVDTSNVSGGDSVTLLPLDSDRSANLIRDEISRLSGKEIAVIISDTVGRPWREGLVDIAIGCSGIRALHDQRGELDNDGFELNATVMATADQVASAAGLLMEKSGSVPVVIVRGYGYDKHGKGSAELIRDPLEDLFR